MLGVSIWIQEYLRALFMRYILIEALMSKLKHSTYLTTARAWSVKLKLRFSRVWNYLLAYNFSGHVRLIQFACVHTAKWNYTQRFIINGQRSKHYPGIPAQGNLSRHAAALIVFRRVLWWFIVFVMLFKFPQLSIDTRIRRAPRHLDLRISALCAAL